MTDDEQSGLVLVNEFMNHLLKLDFHTQLLVLTSVTALTFDAALLVEPQRAMDLVDAMSQALKVKLKEVQTPSTPH